jgi:predicted GNAT family N-acyltransferase
MKNLERKFFRIYLAVKNPNVGYKLLARALKFAKEKEFKYVTMTCAMRHPKAQKIGRFYEKMGFVKDSETYIVKL